MAQQHIENLFRRFKGEPVSVKTISGGIYEGKVMEITNDYVCLGKADDLGGADVFLFFDAIESMTGPSVSSR